MEPTKKEFYKVVLRQNVSQSAIERFHVDTEVELYAQEGRTARHFGTQNLFKNLSNELRRTRQNHKLPYNTRQDQVVVTRVAVFEAFSGLKYTYTFKTNDEAPATLSDMNRAVMYVWDTSSIAPVNLFTVTKGSANKVSHRAMLRVNRSSSEDSESSIEDIQSGSENGNSLQGGVFGKNGDDRNNDDEQDVLLMDE